MQERAPLCPRLWYMWRDNCQSASSVTNASELAPRLRASGYTGVQMSCSQGSSEWWGEEKRKIHA